MNAAATGNKVSSTTNPIDLTHASVPAGTPAAAVPDRAVGPTLTTTLAFDQFQVESAGG